ncbi:TPA: single-stranded DNA-binding protein, partial [Staphylococcus aureus]|nr:single-stranded DNA-binding protein [Staphylococcus aureus]HAR3335758.1 single-stranded DNA-binding protein [Staphylococcus aureus]HAR3344113.1 single-stranded DNA-binding protein [Staphylococcus aureus]HAR3344114.1 single-stranded DNA-binding protein [Staphylococcus aureus]HAR5262265.1 single-stranded DNA-binding protein [Staphylococcus aureus]
KKGDDVVNKPIPKTDKQKAEENNGAQQQTSMSQQSNPFESSGQFGYDDQDLAF